MKCRYDRDADAYLIDGEPCRVDEYGDPTKHCTARRTCNQHIGRDELTCNTCIARTRSAIRQIVALSSLMLPAAIDDGLRSEAASLAGPAADPRAVAALRLYVQGHATYAYRQQRITEATFDRIMSALPDEDEWHPYSVLTRWQMMLSEDYGHPLPARLTIATAASYLDRNLHIVAQDPEQEFALLAREIRKVRTRLESVLHNSHRPDRGAPCPICREDGKVVRLVREYAHWCEDPDCERLHYDDDSGDVWVCPRNRRDHVWDQHDYDAYVEERRGA